MTERSTIQQTLFVHEYPPITVDSIHLGGLTANMVNKFLATAVSDIIGIAASYDAKFVVDAIAFSTAVNILYVNMGKHPRQKKGGKKILCDTLLCHASYQKHGFNMDRLASALHLDLDASIMNAFDIQHARHSRRSIAAILATLSGDQEDLLHRAKVLDLFVNERSLHSQKERLALRAWGSFMATSQLSVRQTPVIDTSTPSKPARFVCFPDTIHPHGNYFTGNTVFSKVCARCGPSGQSETSLCQERYRWRSN
jgi:hypothetical protein